MTWNVARRARLWTLALLGAVTLTVAVPARRVQAGPADAQPFSPWKGEYFGARQGGLFVKVALKGFKASKQTRFLTGNVQIYLYDILLGKPFVINHRVSDVESLPDVWKARSGKFELRSIEMVDAAGVKREWRADKRRTVVVKRLSLSNLGLWTLTPAGKNGLSVKFGMAPSRFKETGAKAESSVRAVINGFTGLEQETFGGKKLEKAAANDYAGDNGTQVRTAVTYTRQIAMFYKLDLFRHNHHAKAIAGVLALSDAHMRTCYTDRLEWEEELTGDVKFTFLLSKETGTMSKLKHTGGTMKDAKLIECVYYELAQAQFPVPENMIGELTYTFDVR